MVLCKACPLHRFRHCIVEGEGSLPADVVLIGEGPGRSEDLLGQPFIGASGRLLRSLLDDVWQGDVRYYLTNAVLCHPTDSVDGDNREPRKEEIKACHRQVLHQITMTQAPIVCFVGSIAGRAFKKDLKALGQFQIVHPAAVLRGGGKSSPYYLHNIRILERIYAVVKELDNS